MDSSSSILSEENIRRITKALNIGWGITFSFAAVAFCVWNRNNAIALLAIFNGFGALAAIIFAIGVIDRQLRLSNVEEEVAFLKSWMYRNCPALSMPLLGLIYRQGNKSSTISAAARSLFIYSHVMFIATTITALVLVNI